MIDLHTHTTASDGRCTPAELVARAAAAGVTTLAVTDHDTVAACGPAAEAAARAGIEFVPGIEITAVADGTDVHVLGYFLEVSSQRLATFLLEQRRQRLDRIRHMIDLLASHGIVLDAEAILRPGIDDNSKSIGRPWIARALVAGGHVATIGDAFDRWLSRGRPAFAPRLGASPEDVFDHIHVAGGVASLAHPGLLAHDEWLPRFVSAGLDAIEVYHTKHDRETAAHYRDVAARMGIAISGGSDYHADESHGARAPGAAALPQADYDRLKSLLPARQSADFGATATL